MLGVNDRHVLGTCRGIDRDGALLLKTGISGLFKILGKVQ
jgi:hypothetical protein